MPFSPRSARLITGSFDPSTAGNLPCKALKEACASDSLRCEETWTRSPPPGGAGASGWSPRTESVLIFRGSLLASVPLPPFAGGRAVEATLDAGGGFGFGFSVGNTTRGLDLALTSTGASSRGTIRSVPSPATMRSGSLVVASAGDGTILVGPASALMIGGSPLRDVPT